MSRFTVISAAQVPPNRRRGGELRVVLGPATTGATTGFLGVLRLDPGEHIAEHYHPYSEEFLYVTGGELVVRLDGEHLTVRAGEGVLVPKEVRHRVWNESGEPAEAVFHLCPLAPRPELGHVDTEPLPAAHEPALQVEAG
ncbi:cupin domain-containing protein [Nonomuraea sp. NPDC049028]|uniref:cupin domain-containing protein n=1 Tax=Nonomuraea sp. NPDC049028 TaxID=3364348 RepID=UPI00371907AE